MFHSRNRADLALPDNARALRIVGKALLAFHDWTFLFGPASRKRFGPAHGSRITLLMGKDRIVSDPGCTGGLHQGYPDSGLGGSKIDENLRWEVAELLRAARLT